MTKKQVWRYYCEFCKKGSLSGGHMGSHEKYCTANPNRICRMHPLVTDRLQASMLEMRAALSTASPDHGMSKLRQLAEDCPMCILAAIRQSGIAKWDGDPENPPPDLGFDFKKELAAAWETINDAKSDKEEQYARY